MTLSICMTIAFLPNDLNNCLPMFLSVEFSQLPTSPFASSHSAPSLESGGENSVRGSERTEICVCVGD